MKSKESEVFKNELVELDKEYRRLNRKKATNKKERDTLIQQKNKLISKMSRKIHKYLDITNDYKFVIKFSDKIINYSLRTLRELNEND